MSNISEKGKNKYSESKRLIRKAMREKQLVLFIGAGCSVDSGMPRWKDAVDKIAEKLGIDVSSSLDYLKIPQYYYNSRGEKEYIQLMREIFKYEDKLYPNPIHNTIIKFGVDTILTTNYDNLLEQAAEDNGEFLRVISQDSDLPFRKGEKELIKIHGDFEHDNFVLKEDDYLHYHSNFKLIENYVKSLIGTKTVLFIGYSLSDPDVKHIIAWVNEVLDEKFQRAYLIDAANELDTYEEEYFRNLGINVIYSKELLGDSAAVSISTNLLSTLEYFLDSGKNERNAIDIFYDELKPFSTLNYAFRKYIDRALAKVNNNNADSNFMYVNGNILNVTIDDTPSNEDVLANQLINELEGKESGDDKTKTILKVLKNSYIRGFRVQHGKKVNTKEDEFPFPENDDPEWVDAIFNYDYRKLEQIKEHNAKILSEKNTELYMIQAYICSFLKDYLNAFYCLGNAANYYYRKREYAWYFIALWNKRNIGNVITQDFIYNSQIDKQTLSEINDEVEQIDLEKTILSIPDLGNDDNSFLKDLIGFKFNSELLYEALSDSFKAKKEAETAYMIFGGLPAYENLRIRTIDYYRYTLMNYLMVDRYREALAFFDLFARTILMSVSAPDRTGLFPTKLFSSGNVHADSLSEVDIHLLMRYKSSSELKKLFAELNVDRINLDSDAKEYINKLLETIPYVLKNKWQSYRDVFWTYLTILSHVTVEESLTIEVLSILNSIDKEDYIKEKREAILDFIISIYNSEQFHNKDICYEVKKLLVELLRLVAEDVRASSYYGYTVLLMGEFCKEGGVLIDDPDIINLLYEKKKDLLVTDFYNKCSEGVKSLIQEHFNNWSFADNYSDCQLYANLIYNQIIEPENEVEKKVLSYAKKTLKKENEDEEHGKHSFPKSDLLERLVEAARVDKIYDKQAVKSIAEESGDEFSIWLLEPENYDYSRFELTWLQLCYPVLLMELASSERVRGEIVRIFKEKYAKEDIQEIVIKRIVQYFIE